MKTIFLFVAVVTGFFASSFVAGYVSATDNISVIEVLERADCAHCQDEKDFGGVENHLWVLARKD